MDIALHNSSMQAEGRQYKPFIVIILIATYALKYQHLAE